MLKILGRWNFYVWLPLITVLCHCIYFYYTYMFMLHEISVYVCNLQHKCSSSYNEDFVLQLEKELVQARLREAEAQCALKEMQDKVLDMEKVRPT